MPTPNDAGGRASSKLRALLGSQEGELLHAWQEAVRVKTDIGRLPLEAQEDHLPTLLSTFIRGLEGMADQTPEAHLATPAETYALGRLAESVELSECLKEVEELRCLVFDAWLASAEPTPDQIDLKALQQAFGALTREVVDAYSRMERRQLEALNRISSAAIEGLPVEELLRRLLSIVVETVSSIDTAAVFLPEGEQLRLRAAVGLREEEVGLFRLAAGEGFAGYVAAERKPAFLPFAAAAPQMRSAAIRAQGVRAFYGIPLLSRAQLVGVVTAGSLTEFAFSKLTLHLLQVMADRAADVIAYGLLQDERARMSSEIAKAAAAAQARAAELDATIDAIADGIIVFAPNSSIVRLNAAAEAMLGYTPEQRALTIDERIGSAELRDSSGKPFAAHDLPGSRALRGETVRGVPMLVRSLKSGKTIWVSVSGAPILGPAGEPRGAVTTFSDITRLHDLQRQHEDLVRMISHDLRTPLGTASMQAQLLVKNPVAPTEKIAARGKTILRSCGAMNAMIEDLVEMARFDSGQLKLRLQPLDLKSWLTELIARLEGVLETPRIRLTIAADQLPVEADAQRLERVLVNLLSNALKYSPEDSPVQVRVTREPQRGDDWAVVAVRDRGSGISPEVLPHIFERFYRAEGTKKAEGLGMGLYIARLLVEAHRGRIEVQSEPGLGSTFSVFLPAQAPA